MKHIPRLGTPTPGLVDCSAEAPEVRCANRWPRFDGRDGPPMSFRAMRLRSAIPRLPVGPGS